MSALLGRIPSAVGYQPTLATDMGTMQERITTTQKGSITSVQVCVCVCICVQFHDIILTHAHKYACSNIHHACARSYTHTYSQAVFVPADDLTDPAPATTFAHLDATTVLSRAISELGIYPAVDPLDSTSRIMDPNIVGEEHYNVARGVQKILQVRGAQ